ncbi:hypothetical protein EBR43_02855 [bacterium]|nr:hypothetical protein [bacterium]
MSEKNQTITEGLGLNEEYFEAAKDLVINKLEGLETISEALEAAAESVRDEELGESNFRISDYEKKLILAGFIMGCIRTESMMSQKLDELKAVMTLMAMSKKIGKNKDGSPIFGGIIDASDMPNELRDLLEKLSGDGDSDDSDDD